MRYASQPTSAPISRLVAIFLLAVTLTAMTVGVLAAAAAAPMTGPAQPGHESAGPVQPAAVAQGPAVTILKLPDDQKVANGGVVTFTIVVSNSGEMTLTNVVVNDLLVPACGANLGGLGIAASKSYTCAEANVTQSFLNKATVTGQDVVSATVVDDSDTALVEVADPDIDIRVIQGIQSVERGANARFNIVILNTSSSVDLTDIQVSAPEVPDCNEFVAELTSNASHPYSCMAKNVQAPIFNVLTVSGTNEVGGGFAVASVLAQVEVVDLAISLRPEPAEVRASGDSVSFTVALSNTGSVSLALTTLESDIHGDLLEPQNGALRLSECAAGQILPPEGGSYICEFEAVIVGEPDSELTYGISATASDVLKTVVARSATATLRILPPPTVHLPIVLRDYHSEEPNNGPCDAAPIDLNRDYRFLPDDVEDWYSFLLPVAGNLEVVLKNFVVGDGQLVVYRGLPDCNSLLFLANNGSSALDRSIALPNQPTGNYFARVINNDGTAYSMRYLLRVNVP